MPKDFDPSQTGALHNANVGRWQQEQDFAEMTRDILLSGRYLPRFSAEENPADYDYRRSMSCPLDMIRDAVRIRVDNIFRTPPKREVGGEFRSIIEPLIADADNDGTPLDAFMKAALRNQYITGSDVVTQMSAVPAGQDAPLTVAQQQAQGLRPYFLLFRPLERMDWATNGSKNFLWARYCLGEQARADELAGGPTVTDYLTLTQAGYRIWRVTQDDARTKEVAMVGEGFHALERPPITKFYFAESDKSGWGGVPMSLITRPCDIARVAMNLKSQADSELLAAVPRWLASGFGPKELPATYGGGILVSANNPEAKIVVVQGNVSHITEKREWLNLYIGEMLRLLKFRGGMAELSGNQGSGVKLAIERTDMDNELRSTAAQCEQVELEMMRQAVVLATGKEIPPAEAQDRLGYSVQYNRDFVLEPVGEMLDNIQKFVNSGFVADSVPTITREMLRQLAGMLARPDSSAHGEIMAEIDAAEMTGVADPMPTEGDELDGEDMR